MRERDLHGLSLLRTVAIFRRHADSGAHYALQYARPVHGAQCHRTGPPVDRVGRHHDEPLPVGHSPVHLVVLALLDMHGTRLLALPGRGGIPENASAGIPGSVVVVRRLSERGFLARIRAALVFRRLGIEFRGGRAFPREGRQFRVPRPAVCHGTRSGRRHGGGFRHTLVRETLPRNGLVNQDGRSRRNIGMPNAACSPTRATGATIRSMSTCWRS